MIASSKHRTNVKICIEPNNVELQIQEDKQIEKELEFYSQVPVKREESNKIESIEENEEEQTEIVSPVLKMNPFIKKRKSYQDEKQNNLPDKEKRNSISNTPAKIALFKKKLSKFPSTVIETNSIVRSRYFTSESAKIEHNTDDEECKNVTELETTEFENTQKTDVTENSELQSNIVTTTAIVHINEKQSKSSSPSSINESDSDECIIIEKKDCSVNHENKLSEIIISERDTSLTQIDVIDEIVVADGQENCNSKSPKKSYEVYNKRESKIRMATSSPKVSIFTYIEGMRKYIIINKITNFER